MASEGFHLIARWLAGTRPPDLTSPAHETMLKLVLMFMRWSFFCNVTFSLCVKRPGACACRPLVSSQPD
jgi:hypothetical protein